jgi:hypothetical protein
MIEESSENNNKFYSEVFTFLSQWEIEYQDIELLPDDIKNTIAQVLGIEFHADIYYNNFYLIASNKNDIESLSYVLNNKGFALYHYEYEKFIASFKYIDNAYLKDIIPQNSYNNKVVENDN